MKYLLFLMSILLLNACDSNADQFRKLAKKQVIAEYRECTKENISVTSLEDKYTLALYCDRDFLVIAFCHTNNGCAPDECKLYRVQPPKKNYSEARP